MYQLACRAIFSLAVLLQLRQVVWWQPPPICHPSAVTVFQWFGHYWHNCQRPLSTTEERKIWIKLKISRNSQLKSSVTDFALTASISSSSSSMVDTVTELNLPIFLVCLVTITLRGWAANICFTSLLVFNAFSFLDWTMARLSINVTLGSVLWR